jgi:hypothetical protein
MKEAFRSGYGIPHERNTCRTWDGRSPLQKCKFPFKVRVSQGQLFKQFSAPTEKFAYCINARIFRAFFANIVAYAYTSCLHWNAASFLFLVMPGYTVLSFPVLLRIPSFVLMRYI